MTTKLSIVFLQDEEKKDIEAQAFSIRAYTISDFVRHVAKLGRLYVEGKSFAFPQIVSRHAIESH